MIKHLITISCTLFVFFTPNFAQDLDNQIVKKYAENSFRDGDYEFALTNYLILFNGNEQDIELNYKLGICYTEINIDKQKPISHLEFVVSYNNYPIRSYYYLGRAYMYSYRFTEAVEAFYDYKANGVSELLLSETDRLIEMCYNALELINSPKYVTFELVDSTINSQFDDYNPFVSSNGESMVYTSNRTYVDDFEDYIANVFYSDSKKGFWNKGLVLPEVTTYDNEESVGFTTEGDKVLVYSNGDYSTHDIKIINKKGSKFSNVESGELPLDMNTDGIEMGACLSADGNTLYYVSDRRGGRGGLDIYEAKKDASGQWMASENIGSSVNTEYDENFPTLSHDGKYLYFASKGHNGIGGYDLFRSFINPETNKWGTPINMGVPINTPSDNTTISFLADGKTAYLSAIREEGYGKQDIYKVTFGDENVQPTIFAGSVFVGTESNNVPYSEDFLKAYATIYDLNENIIGQFEVLSDGGSFFASLYPGTYNLKIEFSGAKSGYSEKFTIAPDSSNEPIFKMYYLKPI